MSLLWLYKFSNFILSALAVLLFLFLQNFAWSLDINWYLIQSIGQLHHLGRTEMLIQNLLIHKHLFKFLILLSNILEFSE